jgi:hypothetical protein
MSFAKLSSNIFPSTRKKWICTLLLWAIWITSSTTRTWTWGEPRGQEWQEDHGRNPKHGKGKHYIVHKHSRHYEQTLYTIIYSGLLKLLLRYVFCSFFVMFCMQLTPSGESFDNHQRYKIVIELNNEAPSTHRSMSRHALRKWQNRPSAHLPQLTLSPIALPTCHWHTHASTSKLPVLECDA